MKKFHLKSLIIGIVATLTFLVLTSNITDNADNIKFVSSALGIGIYNQQTETLYLYGMLGGKLKSTPAQTFKVSEDGSSLTEIK